MWALIRRHKHLLLDLKKQFFLARHTISITTTQTQHITQYHTIVLSYPTTLLHLIIMEGRFGYTESNQTLIPPTPVFRLLTIYKVYKYRYTNDMLTNDNKNPKHFCSFIKFRKKDSTGVAPLKKDGLTFSEVSTRPTSWETSSVQSSPKKIYQNYQILDQAKLPLFHP